jgi:hypothetical protein
MTKRRKQQHKRQDSRAKQAMKHEEKRTNKALAQYRGSPQELFDSADDASAACYYVVDAAPAPDEPEREI